MESFFFTFIIRPMSARKLNVFIFYRFLIQIYNKHCKIGQHRFIIIRSEYQKKLDKFISTIVTYQYGITQT